MTSGIRTRLSFVGCIVLMLAVMTAAPCTAQAACPTGFTGTNCSQCLPNYWGSSCLPCPGLVGSFACTGVGTCSDGRSGTGTCACYSGYAGPACANANILGLSPTHGPAAGGTTLTITGNFFGTIGTVTVGGVNALVVNYGAGTQITCHTPPGTGTHQAVQVTPSGGSPSAPVFFDYDAAPTVPAIPAEAVAGLALLLGLAGIVALRKPSQ
jgi:hypothetical protein